MIKYLLITARVLVWTGFVLLSAYLVTPKASADYLYLGAWSYHVDAGTDFNDRHDLIAYQRGKYFAGTFVNSFNDRTAVLARQFELAQYGDISLSAVVGVSSGYKECPVTGAGTTLCPYAAATVFMTKYTVQPGLIIAGKFTALTFRVAL